MAQCLKERSISAHHNEFAGAYRRRQRRKGREYAVSNGGVEKAFINLRR